MTITNHAIQRYAQRIIGMSKQDSKALTHKQCFAIRQKLHAALRGVDIKTKAIIKSNQFDCRFVILQNVLVTVMKIKD